MLPSLSVSVGVPPVVLTVTASVVVRVKVTVLPASRSPLDGDSAIALIVGVVVSTMTPVNVSGRPDGAQRIAGEVGDRAGDPGYLKRSGVLPSPDRVAEHQRTGAGAADITGGAAVVERQRRRAGHVRPPRSY